MVLHGLLQGWVYVFSSSIAGKELPVFQANTSPLPFSLRVIKVKGKFVPVLN
jgi:hypothetical protein